MKMLCKRRTIQVLLKDYDKKYRPWREQEKKKAKVIMDFSNVTRDRIYIEKWHSFFFISICRVKYILSNKLAYWINSVDVILHRYTYMYVRFCISKCYSCVSIQSYDQYRIYWIYLTHANNYIGKSNLHWCIKNHCLAMFDCCSCCL